MRGNRIDRAFDRLRSAGRRGLIPFIAAGDPSLACTAALVRELAARGADVVELGVPFSDPLADGVVNQRAYQRALASGATLPRVLDLVREIRRDCDVPIVLMSYINPIHRFGLAKFPEAARAAGVDGVIISDCPPEEMAELLDGFQAAGVSPILLVAPTSPARRIALISAKSGGYIYYVSLRGVTGPRADLPTDLADGIRRIRSVTGKPVAVGFGISTPQQARAVARHADAVIVGSALVARIESLRSEADVVAPAGEFLGEFRKALDMPSQGVGNGTGDA